MFRILLALFALCFVLASNAAAQCPVLSLFPPLPARRITVVHKHYAVEPMVAAPVVSVPVVEAPAAEIVAPAPVTVYQQRTYLRAAPMVSADVVAVAAGARPRPARKAAHHSAKAVWHTARAAYWAGRS